MGVTNPAGEERFIAAAFPSSCGKTNMAMMTPCLPGWKVRCVGDDIAWMRYALHFLPWRVNAVHCVSRTYRTRTYTITVYYLYYSILSGLSLVPGGGRRDVSGTRGMVG